MWFTWRKEAFPSVAILSNPVNSLSILCLWNNGAAITGSSLHWFIWISKFIATTTYEYSLDANCPVYSEVIIPAFIFRKENKTNTNSVRDENCWSVIDVFDRLNIRRIDWRHLREIQTHPNPSKCRWNQH